LNRAKLKPEIDPQNSSNTIGGVSTMPTGELPDGVPENGLSDAKFHNIGHLQSSKTIDS